MYVHQRIPYFFPVRRIWPPIRALKGFVVRACVERFLCMSGGWEITGSDVKLTQQGHIACFIGGLVCTDYASY